MVPFENATPINQKGQHKRTEIRLIRLIGVIVSNGTMLSVSDEYDSVNERIQEISKLMKLHIQGMQQNAHKFIRQLAHWICQKDEKLSSVLSSN